MLAVSSYLNVAVVKDPSPPAAHSTMKRNADKAAKAAQAPSVTGTSDVPSSKGAVPPKQVRMRLVSEHDTSSPQITNPHLTNLAL